LLDRKGQDSIDFLHYFSIPDGKIEFTSY